MKKRNVSMHSKRLSIIAILLFGGMIGSPLFAQDCNGLQLDGTNGQITIAGLSSPIEIIDIYNASWQRVFRCSGGDCGTNLTVPNLATGVYHLDIQMFDANWSFQCRKEQDLNVSSGSSVNQPDLSLSNIRQYPSSAPRGSVQTFLFDLNNNGAITANGAYKINAYLSLDTRLSNNDLWVGDIETGNTPVGTIPNVTGAINIPGTIFPQPYHLLLVADEDNTIAEFDETNNQLASASKITITTIGDDSGKTYQCGPIKIVQRDNSIIMEGDPSNVYFFKIHDLNNNWIEAFACSYNCGNRQTANNLSNGNYLVRVYDDTWNLICEQAVDIPGDDGGECSIEVNVHDFECYIQDGDFYVGYSWTVTGNGPSGKWTSNRISGERNYGETIVVSPFKWTAGNIILSIDVFDSTDPSCNDSYGSDLPALCDCLFFKGDNDEDGICNENDNCIDSFNPGQEDSDGDGIGDICDDPRQGRITCQEDIMVEATSPEGAIVYYDMPTYTDNSACDTGEPYLIGTDLPSGSLFPIGVTTLNFQLFDNGSAAFCQNFFHCDINIIVTEPGCSEHVITSGNNKISMTATDETNTYFYKVHDLNNSWNEVFNCSYQCDRTQTTNTLPDGDYLVRIYDSSWGIICEKEVNFGAGSRSAFNNLEAFAVYPNPAQEELYINLTKYNGAQGELVISNIYGQIMHQQTVESVTGEVLRLSLSEYVNGVYYVHIKMKNRQLRSEKFLVKRMY